MIRKLFLSMMLSIFLLPIANLSSQSTPQQLRCLQVQNCQPTGFTWEMSIEWVSSDEVNITRRLVPSVPDDIKKCVNLTDNPLIMEDGQAVINYNDNDWTIPFETGSPALMANAGGAASLRCDCDGDKGKCSVMIRPEYADCYDDSCTGCCNLIYTKSTPPSASFSCGVVFIHAAIVHVFDISY